MKRSDISIITVIIGAIITILTSCSDPLTPVPPQWDVQTNISLVSHTFTISELLEKNQSLDISENGDGTLIIHKSFPVKSVILGDSLRLTEATYQFSKSLGLLAYDIPDMLSKEVTLGTSFSQLNNGTYVVGPQTNTNLVDVTIDVRNYFQSLTFADGKIVLTVTNNYPIPITFPQPLTIMDDQGKTLTSITIPFEVNPGESKSLPPFSLKGLTLTGLLKVSLPFASPGSNGTSVYVDRTQTLHLQASIVDTKIEEAIATIPEQESVYEKTINLNDQGIKLQSGIVKSGTLEITINNYIPVGATVDVAIKGIRENGSDIHRFFTIEPRSNQYLSIPLAGYQIQPINETELTYAVRVKTISNQSETVTLHSTDSVGIIAKLKNVTFKSLSGKVETRIIEINQTQKVDFASAKNFSGTFSFVGAKIWTVLNNGIAIPVQILDGKVTGLNTNSSREASITIPASRIESKAKTTINLSDQEVLNFLNTFGAEFPDRFSIQSRISLNPDNIYGTVFDTDSISGELNIEMPLHFSLKDGMIQDTTKITLDKNNRKRLENVKSGKLHFEFDNGLPVSVRVEPEILDAQNNVLINTASTGSTPIEIPAASVDANGRTTVPTSNNLDLKLNEDDFKKLMLAQFVRVKVIMNTQGSQPVAIRTTDYIKMRAYATIDFNTNIAGK